MSTTTRVDPAAVGAATLPYALYALGEHIIDHQLASPSKVDADAHNINVWLLADHVPLWRATTTTVGEVRRAPGMGCFDSHQVDAILHGSCVQVTLRWIVMWEMCDHPACAEPVAPYDAPAPFEPGCQHGENLCGLHKLHCTECVHDLRQTRSESWAVR